MNTGIGLIILVISTLLLVVAFSFQDAFASENGPKQKHLDKHEEKHGDKHKDKHEKHEDKHEKHEDKHNDKKKEKLVKKIKEKITSKIKEKLAKHKEKIIYKINEKISNYKENSSKKIVPEIEDDLVSQNSALSDLENEVNTDTANDFEEINPDTTNDAEEIIPDIYNEDYIIQIPFQEVTKKFEMNLFKGSGNDYAPTLGTDRYGNNYVNNGFTFNEFVTDVDNFKTHMPLQTLQVGQLNTVVLKIYDNRGASKIEHVELAFGLENDQFASQSKNKIIWKQNIKGDQIILEKDSDNLLMDVSATGKANEKIMEITFNFAFREPMDKSKIGLVVWDQDKNSRTVYFNDGIEVVGQSLNPPKIVTILDEKGYPVKITMTGKNEGIDEFGNIWTHNSPWIKQGKTGESHNDTLEEAGNHGFDRNHGMFDSYKKTQALTAQEKLKEILGGNNIYNFND